MLGLSHGPVWVKGKMVNLPLEGYCFGLSVVVALIVRGTRGAAVRGLSDSSQRGTSSVSVVQGELSSLYQGSKAPRPAL